MINVAKILSFTRTMFSGANVTDVKVDIGGGDIRTAHHYSSPGDDSNPLTSDYAIVGDIPQSGGKVAHGYLDPINAPVANEGDKRIYGRSANGSTVNQVWLKNDGSVLISNDNGNMTMAVNGDFLINGVTIKANGDLIVPTSLTLNGKELDLHTHPIAWTDPAGSGTSGPNN